jgi:hypothetical protein
MNKCPLVLVACAVAPIIAIGVAAPAKADYTNGCEAIDWGFLGRDTRTVCDGPRRPDGSWDRGRLFNSGGYWLPARTTCSGGSYSSTCYSYEKTYLEWREIGRDFYVLTDDIIPFGEPGWLPEGAKVGNAASTL